MNKSLKNIIIGLTARKFSPTLDKGYKRLSNIVIDYGPSGTIIKGAST